ncbi:hypothetical protein [Bradyrhizobium sp. McL0616]|uniref:hypothetical protein n=1 Tax=Bradyrhizobium sp. McL0616 TaxID=3415674 RepID=UPI003CF74EA9
MTRGKQIAHLRRVFAHRGGRLPDTETGRQHLLALLRVLATIPRIKKLTLVKEALRWAPLWSEAERSQLVYFAVQTPPVHRKETLGRTIGLVDAEREACKAWSFWPIDLSLAEANLRKQQRERNRRGRSVGPPVPVLSRNRCRRPNRGRRRVLAEAVGLTAAKSPAKLSRTISSPLLKRKKNFIRATKPSGFTLRISIAARQSAAAPPVRWRLEDDGPCDGVGLLPPPHDEYRHERQKRAREAL